MLNNPQFPLHLVGLGGGILEALINPLVQDEHPSDSGRYLNIVNAFFSVGVLISVLVVGDLLTREVSWRILIAGLGGLALLSGMLFFVFGRGTPHHGAPAEAPEGEKGVALPIGHRARAIVRSRSFWLFAVAMFCGGGAEGGFTFWSASYIQLNFDGLARMGAFGTAAFAGGMVVGRFASGHFVKQQRLHLLVVVSAVLGVVASLGAWAVETMASFVIVVFFAGLTIACFWPSIQAHAAATMRVDSRATGSSLLGSARSS